MNRLMKVLKAWMTGEKIHILMEDELHRYEIDAAFIGYDEGYSEARLHYTGTKEERYRTVGKRNGVTIQMKH